MWDRDLEALSVALDDLDKADDEEAGYPNSWERPEPLQAPSGNRYRDIQKSKRRKHREDNPDGDETT